jgi:hypothetical protein
MRLQSPVGATEQLQLRVRGAGERLPIRGEQRRSLGMQLNDSRNNHDPALSKSGLQNWEFKIWDHSCPN